MEVDEGSDQQSSTPIRLLCMRIWRMSLRRMKSAIISWDGSSLPYIMCCYRYFQTTGNVFHNKKNLLKNLTCQIWNFSQYVNYVSPCGECYHWGYILCLFYIVNCKENSLRIGITPYGEKLNLVTLLRLSLKSGKLHFWGKKQNMMKYGMDFRLSGSTCYKVYV